MRKRALLRFDKVSGVVNRYGMRFLLASLGWETSRFLKRLQFTNPNVSFSTERGTANGYIHIQGGVEVPGTLHFEDLSVKVMTSGNVLVEGFVRNKASVNHLSQALDCRLQRNGDILLCF